MKNSMAAVSSCPNLHLRVLLSQIVDFFLLTVFRKTILLLSIRNTNTIILLGITIII